MQVCWGGDTHSWNCHTWASDGYSYTHIPTLLVKRIAKKPLVLFSFLLKGISKT